MWLVLPWTKLAKITVADAGNRRIRVVDTDGIVRTLVGGGTVSDPGAGIPPELVRLANPAAVSVSQDGRVFITEQSNSMVLVVEGGLVKRFMGAAPPWEGNPLATYTGLSGPGRVAASADGSLYFPSASRIFRVSPDGVLHHLAGSGAVWSIIRIAGAQDGCSVARGRDSAFRPGR